jgi:hypothetical protein
LALSLQASPYRARASLTQNLSRERNRPNLADAEVAEFRTFCIRFLAQNTTSHHPVTDVQGFGKASGLLDAMA